MKKRSNDSMFSVLLFGNKSSEQSFYLNKLTGKDAPCFISTIGINYEYKTIKIDNETIKLTIWNSVGQERIKHFSPIMLKPYTGIILLYDITDRNSFTFLTENDYCNQIKTIYGISVKVMLIGNNCENEGNRQVTTEEAKIFASTNNMLFFEVSTIINKNIEKSIIELTKEMLKLPKPIVNNENKLNLRQTGKELKHNYISKK